MAYIRAAAAGNFSNPATWVGGTVPTSGDIACSGSYRITVDVADIYATLSASNVDWVAGGGSALATNHSGGFTFSGKVSYTLYGGVRYECYKTVNSGIGSADITISNASVTVIGDVLCVGGTANPTAHGIFHVRPDDNTYTSVLNFYNVYLRDGASFYSTALVQLEFVLNVSKVDVNFLAPVTAANSNTFAGNALLRTTTTIPYSFNLTFYSTIITRAFISAALGGIPTGSATLTFHSPYLSQGNGVCAASLCTNFKEIYLLAGFYISDNVTGASVITLGAETTTVVTGNMHFANLANTSVIFSGNAPITITGDIIREPSYAGVSNTVVTFNNASVVTVTGIIRELASAQTSAGISTTYRLMTFGTTIVGFICGGIVGVGYCDTVIQTVSSPTTLTITINGDVDFSQCSTSSTQVKAILLNSTGVTCTITGNVYAPLNGSNIVYDNGVISVDAVIGELKVLGSVYGSERCAAIVANFAAVNSLINLNRIVASDTNSGITYAVPAVVSLRTLIRCNELVCGATGRLPTNSPVRFNEGSTAVIRIRDVLENEIVMMPVVNNTLPAAQYVQEGISIGSTAGTLIIPEPNEVKLGVNFGANQVGTYSLNESFTSNLEAIKEQTDKLTFNELPTSSAGDQYWNNVGFLSHFENLGSTTFADETGKAVVLTAPTRISDMAKYRGNAGLFCNQNGFAQVNYHTSMDMLAGDFTIEISVALLNAISDGSRILSASGAQLAWAAPNGIHWLLQVIKDSYFQFSFNNAALNLAFMNSTTVPVLGQWYHLAVSRIGSTMRLFVNGNLEATLNSTVYRPAYNPVLGIGVIPSQLYNTANHLNGFIDELRLTKGVGRYSANYILSTKPFSNTELSSPDYELITSGSSGAGGSVDLTPISNKIDLVKTDTSLIKTLLL